MNALFDTLNRHVMVSRQHFRSILIRLKLVDITRKFHVIFLPLPYKLLIISEHRLVQQKFHVGDNRNKMVSVLLTIRSVVMNLLAFSGSIFFFSKLMDMVKKHKRHGLAVETLQGARIEFNEDKTYRHHFNNKRLRQKNEVKC